MADGHRRGEGPGRVPDRAGGEHLSPQRHLSRRTTSWRWARSATAGPRPPCAPSRRRTWSWRSARGSGPSARCRSTTSTTGRKRRSSSRWTSTARSSAYSKKIDLGVMADAREFAKELLAALLAADKDRDEGRRAPRGYREGKGGVEGGARRLVLVHEQADAPAALHQGADRRHTGRFHRRHGHRQQLLDLQQLS